MVVRKHYTEKEILALFNKKTDKAKVAILTKALKGVCQNSVGWGSYVNCIARGMGYHYTDDYNEATWVKSK